MFRLRWFLALFAVCAVLIGACDSSELDAKGCDSTCQSQVTWYLASQATLARMWHGAVIARTPQAACIAAHESETSGLYKAENAVSSASGKYQFLDGTWSNVALARRRPDLVGHASDFAPWDQEEQFGWAWEHLGPTPWAGTGCS